MPTATSPRAFGTPCAPEAARRWKWALMVLDRQHRADHGAGAGQVAHGDLAARIRRAAHVRLRRRDRDGGGRHVRDPPDPCHLAREPAVLPQLVRQGAGPARLRGRTDSSRRWMRSRAGAGPRSPARRGPRAGASRAGAALRGTGAGRYARIRRERAPEGVPRDHHCREVGRSGPCPARTARGEQNGPPSASHRPWTTPTTCTASLLPRSR